MAAERQGTATTYDYLDHQDWGNKITVPPVEMQEIGGRRTVTVECFGVNLQPGDRVRFPLLQQPGQQVMTKVIAVVSCGDPSDYRLVQVAIDEEGDELVYPEVAHVPHIFATRTHLHVLLDRIRARLKEDK